MPFRFPLMHLLRVCVVYWYSSSNPRTKFIHYDNCLVIRSCAFPAFLWCISFCLGQHAQGCTQASARARLTRARSAGGCAAPGDSGPVSRVTQGVPPNNTHTHTHSLSLSLCYLSQNRKPWPNRRTAQPASEFKVEGIQLAGMIPTGSAWVSGLAAATSAPVRSRSRSESQVTSRSRPHCQPLLSAAVVATPEDTAEPHGRDGAERAAREGGMGTF